ncbi:MAG: hypothetical protein IAG13_11605 [Deltaproteobacteria bacterium]|nr:hypothetical protein [Nannocystaceae bacterium]
MRSSKTILFAILAPAAFVVAGLGSVSPVSAGGPVGVPLPQNTCETVLCSPGAICIDTRTGPQCIPDPNGPSDS